MCGDAILEDAHVDGGDDGWIVWVANKSTTTAQTIKNVRGRLLSLRAQPSPSSSSAPRL